MRKEYGKLTAEQFKGLIDVLPEMRRQGNDLRTAIGQVPKAKLDQLLVENYSWGEVYELTFIEHLALVACALNLGDYIKRVAQMPDPQQQILDDMWRHDVIEEDGVKFDKQTIIGLVFSLQRTILSVMLYQRTLSGLLQEVREQDSHEALFKAVRVDRSVLSAPTVADRIAKAEIRRDETFFRHLRSALKGPQKKHWECLSGSPIRLVRVARTWL